MLTAIRCLPGVFALAFAGLVLALTPAHAQNFTTPLLTDILGGVSANDSPQTPGLSDMNGADGNGPVVKPAFAVPVTAGPPTSSPGAEASGTEAAIQRSDRTLPGAHPAMDKLAPFASQLFSRSNMIDRSLSVNPLYTVKPGDRISVKIWGAWNYENILTVDIQGNIFLPEIGPIQVAGLRNADLTGHVRARMAKTFTNNVNVYTNLLGTQPIRVFVTGSVAVPGYYPGESADNVLYFLARAGGVDPKRGSYRDVQVLRNDKTVAQFDLYNFLLSGHLPNVEFRSNDTVFVGTRQTDFGAAGAVRNAFSYELPPNSTYGRDLINLARPEDRASHVLLTGRRGDTAYSTYLAMEEFASTKLQPGDLATFEKDLSSDTISISVAGRSGGPSIFTIPRGMKLALLLRMIETDPQVADLASIHIQRKSVADRQKQAIQRALYELQRSVLTGSSVSSTDSKIRAQEAQLVDRFVSKVRAAEPQGRVVIAGADWNQIALEDQDEIVIPQKTDLVLISGEVQLPQSIVWREGWTVSEYIQSAGGLSNRGSEEKLLVLHADGSAGKSGERIEKGDHIMVLPRDDSKYFAVFKDIIEIIYRVALSSAVVISAGN